jgi:DNA polymerase-3 subunit gamma/tau
MSAYQSLARRFRPQTFYDVCQQEAVVTTLKNAIALDRVSHAYLFCGPRGVGKTTLARLFAKALSCKNLSSAYEPCNNCSCCLEITSGQSLDVLEIDGASNRGIDDIRNLSETIYYTPSHAPYKIYIIDEVHMLTKEAFNALLKTLEEPPKHVKFFFATTEPHKVLPTILSRCQRFDLQRISIDHLKKTLQSTLSKLNITAEPNALHLIAECADGSLRDGLSLLDQILCTSSEHITYASIAYLLGLATNQHFFDLDKAFTSGNITYAFTLANTLYAEGKDLSYFLDQLIQHYQTILKYQLKATSFCCHTPNEIMEYEQAANSYTKEQALYILDYLLSWGEKFQRLGGKLTHLELILLHVLRSKQRVSLDTLVYELTLLKDHCKAIAPKPAELVATEPAACALSIESSESSLQDHKPQAPLHTPQQAEPAASEPAAPTPSITSAENSLQDQKLETLLRFASVELNGVLKK